MKICVVELLLPLRLLLSLERDDAEPPGEIGGQSHFSMTGSH